MLQPKKLAIGTLSERSLIEIGIPLSPMWRCWRTAYTNNGSSDACNLTCSPVCLGSDKPVAIVSYDEKPGIQASRRRCQICLPYQASMRDSEYRRHGTLSLLAGIDLLTGKVHALVRDRHRSREFVEFLKLLDAAYPAGTAIKLILDNHSAQISRETKAWLDTRPAGRFELTFTPKHGSWLNLIEGFFSKFARSVLRHIRVTSNHELTERIMAGIDDVNRHPIIHTWSYKLAEAA